MCQGEGWGEEDCCTERLASGVEKGRHARVAVDEVASASTALLERCWIVDDANELRHMPAQSQGVWGKATRAGID